MAGKRALHITFDDHLGSVMEDPMEDVLRWFIDLDKAEMVGLSTGAINEYYEMADDEWKVLESKDANELDDNERDMLLFREIEEKHEDRYIAVEPVPRWTGYENMKAFIATVKDGGLQDRLSHAIQGKGAFSRFTDAVDRVPGMLDAWYTFKRLRQRDRISEWLASEGISCTFEKIT